MAQALIEEILVLEYAFSTFFIGLCSMVIMIVKVCEGSEVQIQWTTDLLTVYAH